MKKNAKKIIDCALGLDMGGRLISLRMPHQGGGNHERLAGPIRARRGRVGCKRCVAGRQADENVQMVDFADDEQMLRRQLWADEFYGALGLVPDQNWPDFVSDEASLYDVQMEDDRFVVRAVQRHYGVTLQVPEDFRRPFWQLLDHLHERRGGGTDD
jgi:hypothetical protein